MKALLCHRCRRLRRGRRVLMGRFPNVAHSHAGHPLPEASGLHPGGAVSRTTTSRHGTLSVYTNLGCRCDECRAAHSAYGSWWRQSRTPDQAKVHGLSTYTNYGCRCDECKQAKRIDNANRRVAR